MAEEMKGILQALGALIEMQKRLVNTLESSNARFDRVDTEILKVNRQLGQLHEGQAAFRSDMTASVRHDGVSVRYNRARR
jgi:hypothetical protein